MPTLAKPNLLQARLLLLRYLDIHPAKNVHADLDPAEVGIVGDPAHIGGYHCGSGRLYRSGGIIIDYSATESPRDRAGLARHPSWASAMDIGEFWVTVGQRSHNLRTFSTWLVELCRNRDPDARDIREVIYSPDGHRVLRWDALGRRSTGDSSHRWHTHISEFRDADGSRMVRLVRRYLHHIGLLDIDEEEDDVKPEQIEAAVLKAMRTPTPYASKGVAAALKKQGWADTSVRAVAEYAWAAARDNAGVMKSVTATLAALNAKIDVLAAKVDNATDEVLGAKLDALAAAEKEREAADAHRHDLLIDAIAADKADNDAGAEGQGGSQPGTGTEPAA